MPLGGQVGRCGANWVLVLRLSDDEHSQTEGTVVDTRIRLQNLVAFSKENTWSDLMACFIETDPDPFARVIGGERPGSPVKVLREHSLGKAGRFDMLVMAGEFRWVAIEAKVLSEIDDSQLKRYEAAFAEHTQQPIYRILYSQRLGIERADRSEDLWEPVSWESLIEAYASSSNTWVSQTAKAWEDHIAAVCAVTGTTIWNDIGAGENLVIALRTRLDYVRNHLERRPDLSVDLIAGGGGRSPVLMATMPMKRNPNYRVIAEVQEGLSTRAFSRIAGRPGDALAGPMLRLIIQLRGLDKADTSASKQFDWKILRRMWEIAENSDKDADWKWDRKGRPQPKVHDKEAWRLLDNDKLGFIGFGFGQGQVKISGTVAFGIRAQLPPTISLDGIVDSMGRVGLLLPTIADLKASES